MDFKILKPGLSKQVVLLLNKQRLILWHFEDKTCCVRLISRLTFSFWQPNGLMIVSEA